MKVKMTTKGKEKFRMLNAEVLGLYYVLMPYRYLEKQSICCGQIMFLIFKGEITGNILGVV